MFTTLLCQFSLVSLLSLISFSNSIARTNLYLEVACPFDTSPLAVDVHCGLLTVPENRSNPNSRPIVLTVMTAESPNPDPASDPILYLTGGPGESAIAAMMPVLSSERAEMLVQERDWVIIDQRGTGYSVPRLDCNIFGIARIVEPGALTDASEVCWQRYAASGIDLAGYTTQENAADLDALRQALGYENWNLFGVSYGTTLALTYMDMFPNGVRAAVLDSTLPPNISFFASDVEMKLLALQRLFDTCRQNADCNLAAPDLAERFDTAIAALNEQPLDLDGLPLSGSFLVFALTNTSVFQRQTVERLPNILDQAIDGDWEALAVLLDGVASGTDAESGFETDLVAANDGMGLAMNCSRDALFPGTRERLIEIATQGATAAALANLYIAYLDACEVWNSSSALVTPPAPVASDIPTLFLVGEWDPSTPLLLAEEAAASLTHSTIVVFPGQGHSVLLGAHNDCPVSLVNEFLATPDDVLDTDCIAQQYPPVVFATS